MRTTRFPRTIVFAVLILWSPQVSAYEALSEEELDRTIASGVEPPQTVGRPAQEPAAVVSTPLHPQEAGEASSDSEGSDAEAEFTLIAYREMLPIVMNRMTGTSMGPLGPNGNYSLSPLDGLGATRGLRASPALFSVDNLPSRSVLFGR